MVRSQGGGDGYHLEIFLSITRKVPGRCGDAKPRIYSVPLYSPFTKMHRRGHKAQRPAAYPCPHNGCLRMLRTTAGVTRHYESVHAIPVALQLLKAIKLSQKGPKVKVKVL
jgi:hypothetical protein